MATPDDRQPVQALGADRRTQRSAYALALGARTGVTSTSPASARNLSLKLRENFASWSRTSKRTCRPGSPTTSSRLRACW